VISLLDNTVMSNFAIVRRPDLLRTTFVDTLATSQQAFDELEAGVAAGKLPDLDWTWLPVWTLKPGEMERYRQILRSLNAGEAACLAMAVERGCRILTDDRDARELARHLQIPLSGTLGVLARLVDLNHLDLGEADLLLHDMVASGYRSPVTSLRAVI
jgi:predicted nucleic acid-binding protein